MLTFAYKLCKRTQGFGIWLKQTLSRRLSTSCMSRSASWLSFLPSVWTLHWFYLFILCFIEFSGRQSNHQQEFQWNHCVDGHGVRGLAESLISVLRPRKKTLRWRSDKKILNKVGQSYQRDSHPSFLAIHPLSSFFLPICSLCSKLYHCYNLVITTLPIAHLLTLLLP